MILDAHLMFQLLAILALAWALGYLFERLGLPMMMGHLLAAFVLGPPLIGFVQPSDALNLLGELGILLVMFHTGLELEPDQLKKNLWPAVLVACGGFFVTFGLGFTVTRAFGGTLMQGLFVGMGASVTAIAVQAVVLTEMGINRTGVGHLIIGAAIVDDIIALVALSILLALAKSGQVAVWPILLVALKVLGFFVLAFVLGRWLLAWLEKYVDDLEGHAFTFGVLVTLAYAALAEQAGLHMMIGAFMAGQFVRREYMDPKVYDKLMDRFYAISFGFFVPLFFVTISFHLKLHLEASFVFFVLGLILAALVGKVLGAGLGARASGRSWAESLVTGFGMNGRGAVDLVYATVAINLSRFLAETNPGQPPVMTQAQFSALIMMSFTLTLAAPLILKLAVRLACGRSDYLDFCAVSARTGRAGRRS